ncbi:tropomyosin-1, isoforms 33/34-like [Lethenteron reissneri]|uniref:tropomyosin-1, isoforms 33/34-like isoform X2 n=1 Tax=Lethenteron reissneri TaxID=7753 RepID=UPI002AB63C7E|nr:tropomyosin-1, isoforms 33/34-like isoform X2 [Lethenteron reissneri]XP_061426373.1 tropomyosin-1, isoforms 33/34-like [Lethenteron reissneri]
MYKAGARRRNPPAHDLEGAEGGEEAPAVTPEPGTPVTVPVETSGPEREESAAGSASSPPPPETESVPAALLQQLLQAVGQLTARLAEVEARTQPTAPHAGREQLSTANVESAAVFPATAPPEMAAMLAATQSAAAMLAREPYAAAATAAMATATPRLSTDAAGISRHAAPARPAAGDDAALHQAAPAGGAPATAPPEMAAMLAATQSAAAMLAREPYAAAATAAMATATPRLSTDAAGISRHAAPARPAAGDDAALHQAAPAGGAQGPSRVRPTETPQAPEATAVGLLPADGPPARVADTARGSGPAAHTRSRGVRLR